MAKFNKDILKFFLLSVAAFVLYYVLLFYVIGIKTPRRKQLEERSAMLDIRQKDLDGKLRHAFSILDELQERDNNIYRPAFLPGKDSGGELR